MNKQKEANEVMATIDSSGVILPFNSNAVGAILYAEGMGGLFESGVRLAEAYKEIKESKDLTAKYNQAYLYIMSKQN